MTIYVERLKAQVDVDTLDAERQLASFGAEVDALAAAFDGKRIRLEMGLDESKVIGEVVATSEEAQAAAPTINMSMEVDAGKSLAEMLAEGEALQAVADLHPINMKVEADFSEFDKLKVAGDSFLPMVNGLDNLVPLLNEAGDAGGGFNKSLSGMASSGEEAGSSIAAMLPTIGLWAGIIVIAGGAIGALVSAVGALIAILATVPAAIMAVVNAIGVLFIAIKPLISLFQAYQKEQQVAAAGGKSLVDMQHEQASAAHQYEAALRNLTKAQQAAQDNEVNAARRVREANEAVSDARSRLTDAELELSRARDHAKESLDRLMLSEQQNADDQVAAQQRVADAYMEVERVKKDPNKTAQDLKKAQLALKQAQLDVQKTQMDGRDIQEKLNDAQAKGIDKSDDVTKAQHDYREAVDGLNDSLVEQTRAQRDQAQQVVDSQQAIADAMFAVEQAAYAQQKAAEGAGAAGAHAANTFKSEYDKLSPSTQAFVDQILNLKDAFKGLTQDVQEHFFKGLAERLAPLAFVWLPIIHDNMVKVADSLNQTVQGFMDLSMDPQFIEGVKSLGDMNVTLLDNFGQGLINITKGMVGFMDAARPFTEWFSGEMLGLTKQFSDWATSDPGKKGIAKWLDDMKPVLLAVGHFLGAVIKGFFELAQKLAPKAAELFEKLAKDMPDMFKSIEKVMPKLMDAFGKFIDLMHNYGPTVVDIIGDIATVFSTLFDVLNFLAPVLGPILKWGFRLLFLLNPLTLGIGAIVIIFKLLKGAVEWFIDHGGDILSGLTDGIGKLWDRLVEFKDALLGWAGAAWGFIRDHFVKPLVDWVEGIPKWFKDRWDQARNKISDFASTAWHAVQDNLIDPLVGWVEGIPGWFKDRWDSARGAVADAMSGAWDDIYNDLVSPVVDFFSNLGSNVGGWLANVGGIISGAFSGAWGFVYDHFVSPLSSFFSDLPGNIMDALSGLAGALLSPFRTAWHYIASLWNNSVGSLSFEIPSWVPGIGGDGFSMPKIPDPWDQAAPSTGGNQGDMIRHGGAMQFGGTDFFGGLHLLGERGPEVGYVPPGGSVIPLRPEDMPPFMRGSGGYTNVAYIDVKGSVISEGDLVDKIISRMNKMHDNNGRPMVGG